MQSSMLVDCRDHPPKWQRASFHLVLCMHNSLSTAVSADLYFLQSFVFFAAGYLNHLELWRDLQSFRGSESDVWRWIVLETIKLLFAGPCVEEVRAWIFNPLEMIRDEKHKGGLDEHFAPKPCGS